MTKFSRKVQGLGKLQATRGVLPVLAMEVSKAAAKRDLKPEDALETYIDYYKASSRLKTIDPYDGGVQANVSKLRQIIKSASPELLAKVQEIHERISTRDTVRPLYAVMVAVSRRHNATGKKPTAAEIAAMVRRA